MMEFCQAATMLFVVVFAESCATAVQAPPVSTKTTPSTKVTFLIEDSIGQKRPSGFVAYDGNRATIGTPGFSAKDFKDAAAFLSLLKANEHPVAALLMNRFDEDLRDEIELFEPDNDDAHDAIARICVAINQMLVGQPLFDPSKCSEVDSKVSPNDFKKTIALSQQLDDPQVQARLASINRLLLESAFPDDIAPSHPILVASEGVSELNSGKYWLVASADTSLFKRIELDGQKSDQAIIVRRNGLWLDVSVDHGRSKTPHLFVTRSREQMQQALRWLRFPQSFSQDASIKSFVLRPNVGRDEVQAARNEAMRRLPEITKPFAAQPESSIAENNALFFARIDRLRCCQKILAVAGQLEDAQRIIEELDLGCDFKELHRWAATVARIESRHNSLSHGTLVSVLKNPNQRWVLAAATQLHLCGLSDGDEALRQIISDPPQLFLAYEAALAMLDSTDPRTLDAMRSYLRRCKTFFETGNKPGLAYITVPACLYLLAHGTKEDWQLVAGTPIQTEHIFGLAFLAENLPDMARHLAASGKTANHHLVRRLGVGLRDRTDHERQVLQNELFNLLRDEITSTMTGLHAERAVFEIMDANHLYASCFYPSSLVARKLAGFGPFLTDFAAYTDLTPSLLQKTRWLPQPQHLDIYVDNWLNGHSEYLAQLDYIEPSAIQDSVSRRGAGKKPTAYSTFMAQHRIGLTAWSACMDNYPMGADRRTYFFNARPNNGNAGSIFGVAELRFELGKNGSIDIQIRLDQEPHFDGGAIFGQRVDDWSDWPQYCYVIEGGKQLIKSVELRNADQVVAAQFVGASDDGILSFRTSLPNSESSDWYLDVNLAYLDQNRTLTYSITCSENARRIRRQIDHAMSALSSGALLQTNDDHK